MDFVQISAEIAKCLVLSIRRGEGTPREFPVMTEQKTLYRAHRILFLRGARFSRSGDQLSHRALSTSIFDNVFDVFRA